MGLELIYTSAKKGLKPGSVGFCTVAMSRQMSPTLAATLESLSGYRHLYTAGNGNYADNPVNFCHYLIPDRGRVARVIARIGAAPADYTGRTNKLAHFMVLDSAELPLAGPAWLLERRGLMQEVWQGEPRLIENAAIIPTGDSTPAQCAAWQRVTGDAGWAGELLLRFCDQPEAPVHVICKPGTNLLELFAEALALLPAELRWQIAFSTYFTGLPVAGIKCHWRGIIAGTAMAEGTLDPKSIIDLTRLAGRAADGPCNIAARDGTMIDLSAMRSSVIKVEAPITLATPPALPGRKAGTAKPADSGILEISPLAPEPNATRFFRPHNVDQADTGRNAPRKRRWILPVILGVVAFVVLLVVGAVFVPPYLRPIRQLGPAASVAGPSNQSKPTTPSVPAKSKPVVVGHPAKPAVVAPKPPTPHQTTQTGVKPQTTHPANRAPQKPPKPVPPKSPVVAKTNPARTHHPLDVVNEPIFAGPASGIQLVVAAPPTAATKKSVTSFLVRFPPPVKAGHLILVGNPNLDPGKWKNVGTLPATGNIFRVRWKPNSNAGAGGLGLSVGNPTTLAKISVSKVGILTVHPGSRPNGLGLPYVEQMVVDVRLKNGRKERIQFLPSGPTTTAVRLNKETAARFAVKIPPQLQADGEDPESMALKVERSNNAAVWIAGKAEAVYTVNLAPATRDQVLESLVEEVHAKLAGVKPRKARILPVLGPLKVGLKTSAFTNNYAALMGHLQRLAKQYEREVKLAEKHLKTHKALSKKQNADLARYKKHPNRNKIQIESLKSKRDLHRDLAQLVKSLKGRLNRMEQRLEHLKSLAGTTFRVELYPDGPVLERFTFTRGPSK